MKKFAFALAETLLSICLLAFVIALLLPSVQNDDNQKQFYATEYSKVFNDIFTVSQAILVVDFKSLHDYTGMNATAIRNFFANHLDVSSTWTANLPNTWTSTSRGALVTISRATPVELIGMTLNNGVQLAFWVIPAEDFARTVIDLHNNPNLANIPSNNLMGILFIDINGKANPNTLNKDQYIIPFYTDGIRNNISYKN